VRAWETTNHLFIECATTRQFMLQIFNAQVIPIACDYVREIWHTTKGNSQQSQWVVSAWTI
jgi:hypothetical protein